MSPYYDAVFVGRIYLPEVAGGPIVPPGVGGTPEHPWVPPDVGIGGGPIIPEYPGRPGHPWVPPWWGAWQPQPGHPLPRPPLPGYPVDPGWGIPEGPGIGGGPIIPPPEVGGGPIIPERPSYPGRPGQGLPGRWQVWPAVTPPEEIGGHPDLPDLNYGQWERVAVAKQAPYPAFVPTYIPNVGRMATTEDGEEYEPRYPKRGTPGTWVVIVYWGDLAWAWVPDFEVPEAPERPGGGTPDQGLPSEPVPEPK
jgi:hypothetical protein